MILIYDLKKNIAGLYVKKQTNKMQIIRSLSKKNVEVVWRGFWVRFPYMMRIWRYEYNTPVLNSYLLLK